MLLLTFDRRMRSGETLSEAVAKRIKGVDMFKCFCLCCAFLLLPFHSMQACTGIAQKAENGDWVFGRTMEFGVEFMKFNLLFIPRGIAYTSQTPSNQPGAKWTTKYALVGFNPLGFPLVVDGLNEKGLACGGFYFPGWAEYEKTTPQDASKTISNMDFITWVLSNFATVQEVRQALDDIKVAGVIDPNSGVLFPLHFFIIDETGDKIVVEYVKGKKQVHSAWIGTITNSPTYDWHVINARNYIGISALNKPSVEVNGHDLAQFGQGSGALGLPGDFTPPSRFIRASFLNQVALMGKNGSEQVIRAFKILNQFDIPKGSVKDIENGHVHYEETHWTSASDLTARCYYFHTYLSRIIHSVNLKALDVNATQIKSIAVDYPEKISEMTSQFITPAEILN